MVCYQPPEINDVSIAEAIGQLKRVVPDCSAIQTGRGLGISFGDLSPNHDVIDAKLVGALHVPVNVDMLAASASAHAF
jgi:hypothetical protein